MKEKDFQRKFTKWWRKNKIKGCFELKITHTVSLPFSAVKEHQIIALNCCNTGLGYKIPDVGFDQKPFDFVGVKGEMGYVVVMFYKWGQKVFHMIDIKTWEKEKKISKRKSLTEERAIEIGTKYNLDN